MGYVYFHQQDTENLVADGQTYVGYGAFPPEDFDEDTYDALSEAAKEDIYRAEVTRLLDDVMFPVLRRHGIEPEWNRELGHAGAAHECRRAARSAPRRCLAQGPAGDEPSRHPGQRIGEFQFPREQLEREGMIVRRLGKQVGIQR
ncbi:hypothetical protein C8K38_11018 [Rhodococcus sp. OK611]|nr:hypothetical protein C8K38_11018 [Rhodococcus sp. OK611]SNX91922.1 hypothetical protein SAMN05447004_111209 [Rhodococcus sp. OK270]